MKVLVTGFDPFGGERVNPAYEAVKALPDTLDGAQIYKRELPTAFARSAAALESYLCELQPDIVLCVGQAGGTPAVRVERVAINLADACRQPSPGWKSPTPPPERCNKRKMPLFRAAFLIFIICIGVRRRPARGWGSAGCTTQTAPRRCSTLGDTPRK